MLKAFLFSFIITLNIIFMVHNTKETNASLNRSEQIIKDIKQAKQYLNVLKTMYDF